MKKITRVLQDAADLFNAADAVAFHHKKAMSLIMLSIAVIKVDRKAPNVAWMAAIREVHGCNSLSEFLRSEGLTYGDVGAVFEIAAALTAESRTECNLRGATIGAWRKAVKRLYMNVKWETVPGGRTVATSEGKTVGAFSIVGGGGWYHY